MQPGFEPQEMLVVSAHTFDAIGARACGYRAIYVNRYNLPIDDHNYLPDATVKDLTEIANVLLS
ncbi:MAG: hypothetical protein ACR2IE_19000 [Candidatus Sumerlaeaceae bacterium]